MEDICNFASVGEGGNMVIRSLRWMRGVILKNRKSSEKLLVSLSIVSVGDMVRQERSRCSEITHGAER